MAMMEDAATMSGLLRMNEDSVKLYDEAIQKVTDQQDIRNPLQQFRGDHQQHVQDIQNWFRQTGQRQMQPSEEAQNLAQTILEDARMARGRDEVLKAMTVGEAVDNAEYGEALQVTQDQQVKQILQDHLETEHKHWQFVEQYSPLKVMASSGMMSGQSMGGQSMGRGSMGGGGGYGGGGGMGGGRSGGY
jgi:rubrerythrin